MPDLSIARLPSQASQSTEEPGPQALSRSVPCPSSFPSAVLLLHRPGAQQHPVALQQTEKVKEIADKQSSRPNKLESGRLTSFGGSCVIGFLIVWDLVDIHISRGRGWAGKVHHPLGQNRRISRSKKTREKRLPRSNRNIHLDSRQGLPSLRGIDLGLLGDFLS